MEAINVDTYDAMMHPLKAGRAFPRIDALLRRSRDKSHIVMPMGRSNISEVAPITTYSREMGIRSPDFASLSNRCGVSATFDTESIAPVATCCSAKKVASELIIDWDGTVVACCFDFLRLGKISNLSQVRLADYLKGAQRREFLEAFNQKEWHKLPACRSCRIDDTVQTELIVKSVTAVQSNVIRLNARKLTFADDMAPKDNDMVLSGDAANAVEPTPPKVSVLISHGAAIAVVEESRLSVSVNRVWGPYQLLPRGAYSAQLHLDSLIWGYQGQILCEIVLDEAVVEARVYSEESVEQLLSALFFRTVQDGTLQIRLATCGVDFRFKGVTIVAQRT
jgi:radical SAM protein with 4Fe4S-binding SPASM domain